MPEAAVLEADQTQGSTPESADSSSAPAASQQSEPNRQPDAEKRAQSVPAGDKPKIDKDALAWELLSQRKSVEDVRQTLASADPSKAAKELTAQSIGQKAGAEATESGSDADTPAGEAKADKAKDDAGKSEKSYDGLDAKSLEALRRTKLLPPGEVWKAYDPLVRANLVKQANQILKSKGQLSQQIGREKKDRAAEQSDQLDGSADVDTDEQQPDVALEESDVEQEQQPTQQPPPGQARQQDGRAPTPGQARQPAAFDLEKELKPVVDYFGPEVADPLRKVFSAQEQRNTQLQQYAQRVEQQAQQLAQHGQQLAKQNQLLARQVFAPQERAAFKELSEQVPALKGTGAEVGQARQDVLNHALLFWQASANAGQEMEWKDCILHAARSLYNPDIEQNAQLKLAEGRKASLRGTSARGPAQAQRPNRALNRDEKDSLAWNLLQQRRDAASVRDELSG
jgi:hypothetical protein